MSPGVRAGLVSVVAVVWAANYIAPIFITGHVPNEQLNIAFMTVLGILVSAKKKPNTKSKEIGQTGDKKPKHEERQI